jgi:hypothetical protein
MVSASYVVVVGPVHVLLPPLHAPAEHVCPVAHCLPQLPQLAGSVCVLTQAPALAQ